MHILFLSFFLSVHAQVSDRQKAIEEMMKEHRRIMKELLDDSLFNQEGKSLFQDFFDRMGGGQSDDKILDDIDQFFQGDQFEKFFNNQNPFSRIGSGGHWVETPQERILMVKIDIDPKIFPIQQYKIHQPEQFQHQCIDVMFEVDGKDRDEFPFEQEILDDLHSNHPIGFPAPRPKSRSASDNSLTYLFRFILQQIDKFIKII